MKYKLQMVGVALLLTMVVLALLLCAAFPDVHSMTLYQRVMVTCSGIVPMIIIAIAICAIDNIIAGITSSPKQ